MSDHIYVTHKKTYATARNFNGTLEDAEDIKDWASGHEISWAPVDDSYQGQPDEAPDLSKGVTLDVVSYLGYQSAEKGDWLVKDEQGVAVYQSKHFSHYFTEHKEEGRNEQ